MDDEFEALFGEGDEVESEAAGGGFGGDARVTERGYFLRYSGFSWRSVPPFFLSSSTYIS